MDETRTRATEQFVAQVCAGRDPSHGLEHAQRVRDRAVEINRSLVAPARESDVILVALLHDVADHKYDKDGTLSKKLHHWLTGHAESEKILAVIDAISFSKEHCRGKRWFENALGTYWTKVRDIVSDADKLEALGEIGGRRCLEYGHERGDYGVQHLLNHMLEKLLILKHDYIVTPLGKKLAEPLQDELVRFAILETLKELQPPT